MGSLFTTSKNMKTKTNFGGNVTTPFYLQFVPGIVVDVITHPTAFNSYNQFQNINTIIALPHIQEGTKKTRSNLNNDDRYIPLMRGFVDVPTKGDPVLLCTIAGVKYYLGPLNTSNNPNFNKDTIFNPSSPSVGNLKKKETNRTLAHGESLNFKKMELRRLAKIPNEELDKGTTYNETYGDLLLEGRHGNSIRIGSRDINPYMIISNGRPSQSIKESFADGTLISITEKGTLAQHFGDYINQEPPDNPDDLNEVEPVYQEIFGFTLASDFVPVNEDPPARLMSALVSSVNNDQDVKELIYDYDKKQILFTSERITINSKLDDIYLSSNKDIHIGSKRHFTVSTAKDLIIESEKTYLGDPNKKTMDHMVYGKKVQDALNGIIDLIKEIKITTQLGPQSPMPLPSESSVKSIIDSIISNKHFIEE